MCVLIDSRMFQGSYTNLIIQAGGNHKPPLADNETFDVRWFFPDDDPIPMLGKAGLLELRQAAMRLHEVLSHARPARGEQAATAHIQCRKGQSRSPRVVGAFLMLYYGESAEDAVRRLAKAYRESRTDDCDQTLNEQAVLDWLRQFGASQYSKL